MYIAFHADYVIRQTAKAVCLRLPPWMAYRDASFWIPKSLCQQFGSFGDVTYDVRIPHHMTFRITWPVYDRYGERCGTNTTTIDGHTLSLELSKGETMKALPSKHIAKELEPVKAEVLEELLDDRT